MRRTLSMILALIFTLCICGSTLATEDQWVCEVCGTENNGNFCEDCGAPRPSREWICPNCGSVNETKFCPECGAQKPSAAQKPDDTPVPETIPVLRVDSDYNEDDDLYDRMVWGTNVARVYVLSVTFLSTQDDAPQSAVDVSEAGDRGVLLWFEEADDKYYDMYLAANGNIQAPSDCSSLFEDYIHCETIHFNDVLDTSNATKMNKMFSQCWALQKLDLSCFDTSNVTNMKSMFGSCEALSSINLSSFDTSSVTNMWNMFSDCENLVQLDLSSFDTANVTEMGYMFSDCKQLQSLNIDHFVVNSDTSVYNMFEGCTALSPSVYSHIAPTPRLTSTPRPTPTPRPYYSPLSRNDSGSAVSRLQHALIEFGYLAYGEADGKYGRKTAEAVHRFKMQNNISDSSTHTADKCVATDEMQAELYSGNSDVYAEPYFPLSFLSSSLAEWNWVNGNKLKIRFQVSNISSTRKVSAFKIKAYAEDVWGESLYGDSVYYETTTKTVAPSGNQWSAYLYLPEADQIYTVYARISEVRLSDGTVLSNNDYSFDDNWTITRS